jgi:hypothetical protein
LSLLNNGRGVQRSQQLVEKPLHGENIVFNVVILRDKVFLCLFNIAMDNTVLTGTNMASKLLLFACWVGRVRVKIFLRGS